jgi:hypothetical protein
MGTYLRALQVSEYADHPAGILATDTDQIGAVALLLMRTMREVETKYIHARLDHLHDDLG